MNDYILHFGIILTLIIIIIIIIIIILTIATIVIQLSYLSVYVLSSRTVKKAIKK
jgi:hypothetical protein